jgi:hypothetical protein
VFDGFYTLKAVEVGLENLIFLTLTDFKDFRLFIGMGDHDNTLDQMLWFPF